MPTIRTKVYTDDNKTYLLATLNKDILAIIFELSYVTVGAKPKFDGFDAQNFSRVLLKLLTFGGRESFTNRLDKHNFASATISAKLFLSKVFGLFYE